MVNEEGEESRLADDDCEEYDAEFEHSVCSACLCYWNESVSQASLLYISGQLDKAANRV